jgi:hypothetical protein
MVHVYRVGRRDRPAERVGRSLASGGTLGGMGMAKKLAAFGIAKKVYDEARKPHNQAKIKSAVQKMQQRRGGKRY